jgi:hypothetical protein
VSTSIYTYVNMFMLQMSALSSLWKPSLYENFLSSIWTYFYEYKYFINICQSIYTKDSITSGLGATDETIFSYPAILQRHPGFQHYQGIQFILWFEHDDLLMFM